MPVHRTVDAEVEAKVAALEAAGERVVAISAGDGVVYITTERNVQKRAGGGRETRPA